MRGYALISLLGAVCLWLDEILGIRNFIFTISGFLIVAIFVAISYIHGVFQK
ncbi:MAG: hypothetical protein H6767_09290 [Candidatus Peribacteria bacterium]|nr:MAG: hypothetical protein H6767_09290 [Candidatus Peribacteria bacterium]